jgi:DNA-binding CsgD family transcriptional regulator
MDAWLRLVADELSPLLDRDRTGIFAGFYDCPDPTMFRQTHIIDSGVSDWLRPVFYAGLGVLPPAFVAESFLCRSSYRAADVRGWTDIPQVRDGALGAVGLRDALSINAIELDGYGCCFTSFQSKRENVSASAHLTIARVARHLAAAHRLRRRFAGTTISPQNADAVLEPNGRMHHGRGAATDRSHRDVLGRAARASDQSRRRRAREDPLKAIEDWPAFVGMGWTLVDHFERDGRRYLLAMDNRSRCSGIELWSEREREVVQRALLGLHNKAIAYALGLAPSTVRVLIARAAAKVGARSRRDLLAKAASALLAAAPPDYSRRQR